MLLLLLLVVVAPAAVLVVDDDDETAWKHTFSDSWQYETHSLSSTCTPTITIFA
jgi:hypothetical protein